MEHIVQFAIGIDDKTIQNRIEEHAYADVLDKLTKNAVDSVFAHTNAYSRENCGIDCWGPLCKVSSKNARTRSSTRPRTCSPTGSNGRRSIGKPWAPPSKRTVNDGRIGRG